MPSGDKILFKLTTGKLSKFFGVSKQVLRRYIREGLLDPTSLEDIIEKKGKRYLLDRRRRAPHT